MERPLEGRSSRDPQLQTRISKSLPTWSARCFKLIGGQSRVRPSNPNITRRQVIGCQTNYNSFLSAELSHLYPQFGDRGGLSTSYMLRKYPGPFIEQCPGYARTRYAKRMQERNQSSGQQKRSKDNDLSSDTESDSNSDAATPPPLDARPLVTAAVSAPVLPHHSLRNNPAEVAPIESRKSESFTFVEGKPEVRPVFLPSKARSDPLLDEDCCTRSVRQQRSINRKWAGNTLLSRYRFS